MSINVNFNGNKYTSNTYDFNLTRNEIIELAFEQIGVKQSNQELTPEQYSRGNKLLNAMVKSWAAEEIFLWALDWFTLDLHNSDQRNVSGVDYGCLRNHLSTIDNQPGVGFAWESFWISLGTNTAVPWAEDNNYVSIGNYNINDNIIGIDVARIKNNKGAGQAYMPLHTMSRSDFFSLGDPTVSGQATRYYFRKGKYPSLFLYPVPDDITNYTVEFSAYRYTQDFDNGSDNPDFLQEWIEALYMGLSVRLATQNGIFGSKLDDLKKLAKEAKDTARKADHEFGPFFVKPDLRGKGGTNRG